MDNNIPENIDKLEIPAVGTPPVEQFTSPQIEAKPSLEQKPAVIPETETGQISSNYQPPADTQQQDEAELQQHFEQISPLPEEEKLSRLKLIAENKGLEKAIAVVKKMDDPWLEDKFHDDLMDDVELRAQLEALGKIEKL